MQRCLCVVVCGRGDTKRPEDPVLNSNSVRSRASVEEEITIPGHYGILKGDGGLINCILPEVH
jgi:hypothetical protein